MLDAGRLRVAQIAMPLLCGVFFASGARALSAGDLVGVGDPFAFETSGVYGLDRDSQTVELLGMLPSSGF